MPDFGRRHCVIEAQGKTTGACNPAGCALGRGKYAHGNPENPSRPARTRKGPAQGPESRVAGFLGRAGNPSLDELEREGEPVGATYEADERPSRAA